MNRARWLLILLVSLCGSAAHATPDATPGSPWLSEAQRELAQREYRASTDESGLQAPNRAQGFRTYFDDHGIRLVARSAGSEPIAAIALAGVGRERRGGLQHDFRAPGLAEVAPDAAQVTLRRPGIDVRYENRPDGLAQAITLARSPSGSGRLTVALDITGAELQLGTDFALLANDDTTLRLGAITAQDARGRALPVSIAADAGRLLLVIDDRNAKYPIDVKSVISGSRDELLERNQAGAQMGVSVASAGDVNGDGFADVIVGVPLFDIGQTDEGVAFLYFGAAGAIDPVAAVAFDSDQVDAQLGRSVAGVGDVNGDGFADMIVGAPFYDSGEVDEGAAFVYFGGADGVFDTVVDARLESNQENARLIVAGAGDVNADGFSDVIVGSPLYDNGEIDEGAAFVYFGSAGAFDPTADSLLEPNQASALLGRSVAGAGDVNGDGFADVIVGASGYDKGEADEGAAFVYFGGAGAFDATADALLESNQASARHGVSVAGAGDVNGDGFGDVIVGAPFYDNGEIDEGAAFVYFGSAGAFDLAADARLEPDQVSAQLGAAVAGAGDVNGDGFGDVILGAPFYDNGQIDEGAAFVYFGSAGAFDRTADSLLESNQVNAQLGSSVAGAGDVNGEGFGDVIVGAPLFDNGQIDEGAAFVYFGAAAAFSATADGSLESNQVGAQLGISVAGAGDLNGDGFADVIVGAPLYDSGEVDEGAAFIYFGGAGALDATADGRLESNRFTAQLGLSVSGAGDVNGDGFGDVIVGAPFFDNGEIDEGAAFVYFGAAGAFDPTADGVLESNQANARLGTSVAAAGDVNGNGFADVIVGAPSYGNGGTAFVYFGSAGAFDPTADALLESNRAIAGQGFSVAGAGDVNGDGFGDLIVGAPFYSQLSNEGAAFVYLGSAGAFDTTADALLDEPVNSGAMLGFSVAGAGDVNGDGFADVVVGAPGFGGGFVFGTQTGEGAALVYFGGAGQFDTSGDALFRENQARAELGNSVAGAGDVNGDGFADVIVGAPFYDNGEADEGAAFVYFGGVGPAESYAIADALLESNRPGARLGRSVAGAGDLNGDGFADVILGAPFYAEAQADEGAAFSYFGTARGRPVLANQHRGDGTSPVQPWGLSEQADGFVVSLEATSPRGRERARLQVQACPNGAPFGSLLCGTRTATTWTEVGANALGSTLVLPVTGLSVNRVYHWRARVQYAPLSVTAPGIVSPPNPTAGPWRRLQANADVGDIRTNSSPTATNLTAAEGYVEDTARNLIDIVVGGAASVTATLTLSNLAAGSLTTATAGAVTSTFDPSTGVWTASGAVAAVNTLLAGVTFIPTANFNADFIIATLVSDGITSLSGSKTVTGIAVNDVPTLSAIADPAPIPVNAGSQTINLTGIGIGIGDAAQTVTVTAVSNNVALIPNPAVTYTSPDAFGSVSFTPLPGQQGSATITVTVTDSGGTANGGVNTFSRSFTQVVVPDSIFQNGFE